MAYVHIIYIYRCIHVCAYVKILKVPMLDVNSWNTAGRLCATSGKYDFLSLKSFKMFSKTLKKEIFVAD